MAGPKWRKTQWVWQSLAGSEREQITAEESFGRDLHEALIAQSGVDPDPAVQESVGRIGSALAACVRNPYRRFHFTVVAGSEPNAFALPGGFVHLSRALLELMGHDRDEIAFVLGHEMGHVIKQHAMERIFNDTAFSALARALPAGGGRIGATLKSSTLQMLQSAYSQDNELLADRFGARLARAAGFDPQAAPRMLARLRTLHGRQPQIPLAQYFASHPPLDLRIAELQKKTRPE